MFSEVDISEISGLRSPGRGVLYKPMESKTTEVVCRNGAKHKIPEITPLMKMCLVIVLTGKGGSKLVLVQMYNGWPNQIELHMRCWLQKKN